MKVYKFKKKFNKIKMFNDDKSFYVIHRMNTGYNFYYKIHWYGIDKIKLWCMPY